MGDAYSHEHAAVLLQQLPSRSRVARQENPQLEWGETENMLALIEFWVHCIWWGMTKDGSKGVNKPKPIEPPYVEILKKRRLDGTNKAFVDEILGNTDG